MTGQKCPMRSQHRVAFAKKGELGIGLCERDRGYANALNERLELRERVKALRTRRGSCWAPDFGLRVRDGGDANAKEKNTEAMRTRGYSIALNGGVYGNIEGKRGLRQGDPISPSIFVICGFDFHTKCRGLKLNHLCFTDDVLLFCKGEMTSVLLMLRGLAAFSEATGLKTNEAKSNIYSANMNEHDLADLCEIIGYKRGALPFRYLGVPISAKKISSVDCEMLVDKICARIKSWGSRNLSYAERVMLINSVLLHIHIYWSSVFLLPKKVIKNITAICRNFLWDGKVNTNRVPLVACDLICRLKIEGGLGIIDCETWNQAAIAKYVWNIAKKVDNLWVQWVDHIYLKKKDWWLYKPPQDCNWYWRKICSIRDQFATGYVQQDWLAINGKYTINNGYNWKQGRREKWESSR
ncbi:PREDICTED: uncharacterized protein LOC109218478 [Nicotiana attenuata]|uniref:uncharacterized protein LOC109218478 n=1 Tax=Nicotiana attenuata TaxID=49451 RepID=UPI000904EBCE|nr:PREDICTED: uncharacterized protein LOC109218478 [Nicotiana attenuata]